MASSSTPILARSLRATLALASSSSTSAPVSSPSATTAAARTFGTSSPHCAASKAKNATVPARKVKQAPAAAAAARRRAAFAKPSSVQLSRLDNDPARPPGSLKTPFYRPPPPELDESATPTLSNAMLLAHGGKSAVNVVVPYSKQQLEAFEKFGIKQHKPLHNSLQSRYTPSSLVRSATVDLVSQLNQLGEGSSSSSSPSSPSSPSSSSSAPAPAPNRIVLTGPRHGGKSQLLLQSVACALSADWLVVYIPRLTTYINSTSPYVYSAEEKVYLQRDVVRSLLASIRSGNSRAVLQRVPVTLPEGRVAPRGVTITPATTLLDVLSAATSDSDRPLSALASQQVLDLVLHTLETQTAAPTLFAIDDVQALYLPSLYRTPDYATMQSYELGPIRSLLRFVAGAGTGPGAHAGGPARGAILAATSHSHNGSFPIPSELAAVLRETAGVRAPTPSPHDDGRTATAPPLQNPPGTLHPYVPIDAQHLSHVRACRWTPREVSDAWSTEELRPLFTARWREGRSWNMSGSDIGFGVTPPPSVRNRATGEVTSVAGPRDLLPVSVRGGRGISSLDEYFLMRLVDSGRNPKKFEKAVWGDSML